MNATIMLLPGDGIGPEVVAEARRVLDATVSESTKSRGYARCTATLGKSSSGNRTTNGPTAPPIAR